MFILGHLYLSNMSTKCEKSTQKILIYISTVVYLHILLHVQILHYSTICIATHIMFCLFIRGHVTNRVREKKNLLRLKSLCYSRSSCSSYLLTKHSGCTYITLSSTGLSHSQERLYPLPTLYYPAVLPSHCAEQSIPGGRYVITMPLFVWKKSPL